MAITTAVYVDGYNLYYGRIRNTRFKWIDVVRLFEVLLHDQNPTNELAHVHYFTAMALGRFATHGGASVAAQTCYLRAMNISTLTGFSRRWAGTAWRKREPCFRSSTQMALMTASNAYACGRLRRSRRM